MKDKRKLVTIFVFIFIFICAAVMFFVRIIPTHIVKESPILNGTYTCKELPFASMVFDMDDNYAFYYYDNDVKDKGIYLKGKGKEHFINDESSAK